MNRHYTGPDQGIILKSLKKEFFLIVFIDAINANGVDGSAIAGSKGSPHSYN